MTDRTSNEHVGAKRYKLTTGHSDDAGLGGEGWVVRMSDHFPSFDTAQKWVKSEDYEALRQRFEKACQRVTELESSRDETAPSLALELRSNLHGGPAPALHDGVTGKAKCVICGNFNRFWYVISGCNFCQSCVSEALSSPLEPRRDDPNAPFRWICPKCTTVNGIADEVCLGGSCGTKRPEKAREHHPRCELMQPHGHEPPKCTCSGLNGSPVTTENDNG